MASNLALLTLLSLVASTVYGHPLTGGDDCGFSLQGEIPKSRDPLISVMESGKLKLALPNRDGLIAIGKNQELALSCPGNGNYLKVTHVNSSIAVCRSGKRVTLDGKDYTCCQDMACNQWATPVVKDTGSTCASGKGILVQLGYQIGDNWVELVESCHDLEAANTLYTRHRIQGDAMKWRMRGVSRPKFRSGGDNFYKGFSPDKAYSRANQASVIGAIVGKDAVNKYLIPEKNLFMAKGHMAPDGDFLMPSWQSATFFFINAAPQWQTINGGHWNTGVESTVRKLATKLSADFEVVTGTYGIMTLEGVKMALGPDGKLPVPELYWKLVTNPANGECTVLISTNNPFLDKPPTPICPNVCQNVGWPLDNSDFVDGYVYCCEYSTAKRAIPYMPQANCNTLLVYS